MSDNRQESDNRQSLSDLGAALQEQRETAVAQADPSAEAAEGTVYTAAGQDWDEIAAAQTERADERIVVNMGPQHPSTHGVLRLILELEGETVTEARCGIGYLHTGIEKNMEFRTWVQGVTFATTKSIDRLVGTRLPFNRHTMTAMPYCQRRLAVARLMPSSQQIGFHGLRFARSHKRRASAGASQRNHSSAASACQPSTAAWWQCGCATISTPVRSGTAAISAWWIAACRVRDGLSSWSCSLSIPSETINTDI